MRNSISSTLDDKIVNDCQVLGCAAEYLLAFMTRLPLFQH